MPSRALRQVVQAGKALADGALAREHYPEQGKGVLIRTSIEQLVQERSTACTEQDLADHPLRGCKTRHFKSAVNSGASLSDRDVHSAALLSIRSAPSESDSH
jgi:hypothetical protein